MVLIRQSFKTRFVKTASLFLCLLDYMTHFTQGSISYKNTTFQKQEHALKWLGQRHLKQLQSGSGGDLTTLVFITCLFVGCILGPLGDSLRTFVRIFVSYHRP